MPRSRSLGLDKVVERAALGEERLGALRDVGPRVRHGPRRVAVGHAVRVLASVEVAGVPRHLTVVARVVVRRRLDLAAGEGLLERVRELGDGRGGLGAHGARAVGSDLDLRQPEILQAQGFIEKRLALAQVRGTDALVHGEREVPALAWPALELLHGEVLASDGSALEELDEARGIVPRAHGDHRFLRELRALGVAVADDVVATWVGTGGNRVSTRGDSCFGLAVAIGKCAPIG